MEQQDEGVEVPVTRAARFRAKVESIRDRVRQIAERLDQIEVEKKELEEEAIGAVAAIEALEPLCSELEEEESKAEESKWSDLSKVGIQECCYAVVAEASGPMDAIHIKRALSDRGVDIGRYANPLAVIHTSLKRIPDRVRSFRKKEKEVLGGRVFWVRYYEVIRQTG